MWHVTCDMKSTTWWCMIHHTVLEFNTKPWTRLQELKGELLTCCKACCHGRRDCHTGWLVSFFWSDTLKDKSTASTCWALLCLPAVSSSSLRMCLLHLHFYFWCARDKILYQIAASDANHLLARFLLYAAEAPDSSSPAWVTRFLLAVAHFWYSPEGASSPVVLAPLSVFNLLPTLISSLGCSWM